MIAMVWVHRRLCPPAATMTSTVRLAPLLLPGHIHASPSMPMGSQHRQPPPPPSAARSTSRMRPANLGTALPVPAAMDPGKSCEHTHTHHSNGCVCCCAARELLPASKWWVVWRCTRVKAHPISLTRHSACLCKSGSAKLCSAIRAAL